ncbi:MAG TPA: phosphoglucomutase/phosphomannomutase family protein [Candidatus Limnocylindria bacterium]|nr:phosphoglucomutase/phosphomannomutase family protein [Candidatus Limnocylindria bacterium]
MPVTKIKFGTDGWRAAIAEDYTFHNVRRCARGVAEYLQQQGTAERGVVVAHDRRFASEHFAKACVEVLAAHDIRSFTPPEAVPTQVGSFFTREMNAGAGIVITASHNPWTDNGFKVKADTGGAAAPEMLEGIEATMNRHPEDELPPRRDYDDAVRAGLVESFDPYPKFRAQLGSVVDIDKIRAADRRVLVETLYGCGAGWYTRLLDDGRLTVREMHTERNPYFGGVNPEPIRPNVDEWLAEIPRWGADIGIAFDGDADRVGMATEQGVFVNQLQVYGLLYWYLLDVRGQIGPAVYTVTTTSMAKRLAEIYGTQAYETGVGFKYVGPKMTETNAVIGGEESGGFGFGMHIPERDGLVSGLFLMDLWLTKGKEASEVLAELQALAGPSYYNRIDIRFPREGYDQVKADTLARLEDEAPESLAGRAVVERKQLETGDGFKFYRDDGSWLLIRFSGTEALLRIYVEAHSPEDVETLLDEGRRIAAEPALAT